MFLVFFRPVASDLLSLIKIVLGDEGADTTMTSNKHKITAMQWIPGKSIKLPVLHPAGVCLDQSW